MSLKMPNHGKNAQGLLLWPHEFLSLCENVVALDQGHTVGFPTNAKQVSQTPPKKMLGFTHASSQGARATGRACSHFNLLTANVFQIRREAQALSFIQNLGPYWVHARRLLGPAHRLAVRIGLKIGESTDIPSKRQVRGLESHPSAP